MPGRALWIGRFQPFHLGHLQMAKRILTDSDELVIGIGSAQYSHTPDDPFTAGERFEMIRRALEAEKLTHWIALPLTDTGVHATWVAHVTSQVPQCDHVCTNSPLVRRLFEERGWKVIELPLWERGTHSGTEARRRMREAGDWRSLLPPAVAAYLTLIRGIDRVREIGEAQGGH